MMRKAIVVGVGEYDDIDLNLDNAVNDAIVMLWFCVRMDQGRAKNTQIIQEIRRTQQ